MSSDFVVPKSGGVLVRLRVSPGAKNTELWGTHGAEALELKVAAPPVDGKANAEAGRYLAGLVGVASSGARVIRGLSGGNRNVLVGDVSVARARGAISSHLP